MDAITLLKDDHRTVEKLFKKYEGLGERAVKGREDVARRVVKELSVHAVIEEMILYPRMREALPNGDKLVEHALDEHQEAKEGLAALERLRPTDDKFDVTMAEVIAGVRAHVKEEEGELFPKLRKALGRNELVELGQALKKAKGGAPTHPHPRAPNTPPGNVIAGSVAAVLDKARDVGRKALERR